MSGKQQLLKSLRRQVRRLEQRSDIGADTGELAPVWREATPLPPMGVLSPAAIGAEALQNEAGLCFRLLRRYPLKHRYGNMPLDELTAPVSAEAWQALWREAGGADVDAPATIAANVPGTWLFLDCETMVAEDATGRRSNWPFLVGLLQMDADAVTVEQFAVTEPEGEAALLLALRRSIEKRSAAGAALLVTFNGRTFDEPLLRRRWECRFPCSEPWPALPHLDLLAPSRALWRLTERDCRLRYLEWRVLGVEREADLSGELENHVHIEPASSPELLADRLTSWPIFHHNASDLLGLAGLTRRALALLHEPERLRRGEALYSLARREQQRGGERAGELLMAALRKPISEVLEVEARASLARHLAQARQTGEAIALWQDLAGFRNSRQLEALERLAKWHEHHSKDLDQALLAVERGLTLLPGKPEAREKWEQRRQRLLRKKQPGGKRKKR